MRNDREYVIARLDESGALTPLTSGVIGVRGLAADRGAVYVVVARLAAERGRVRTAVVRVPLRADDTAGPAEPLLRNTHPRRVRAVAVDGAGDVFVAVAEHAGDDESGAILKRSTKGQATTFASGLRDPGALAFGQNGDLVVTERTHRGRVLRFRAPPPPRVTAPPFTNRTPQALRGHVTAGARVTVSLESGPTRGHTVSDAITGAFAIDVPLEPDTTNRLSAVATGSAGAGLASAATNVRIVHDGRLPGVTLTHPFAGAHVRDLVTLRANGEDEGSGVASIVFSLDDSIAAVVRNVQLPEPLVAEAVLDVRAVGEGPRTLTVMATDRAGNSAAAAQLLVVDRTPPETQIVNGPPETIVDRSATFTVGGTDLQSPVIEFAWRLDEGAWSAFGPLSTILLSNLTPGAHQLVVKARDLAGNEDPTPSTRTFSVAALTLRIIEPSPDTMITTQTVWVRGTVEGGGLDVSIVVPLPPEFRTSLSLDALMAATEAGTFAIEVPVVPGMSVLPVTARTAQGGSTTEVVAVAVQAPSTSSWGFDAFPEAGLAPHSVRFGTGSREGARYSLDLESDGAIDYEGVSAPNEDFVYAHPGIHLATLRVTSAAGEVSTSRTAVTVYDRTTLETRLQAAWQGFKDALRAGNVQQAVMFIHSDRRDRWQEYFGQFTPDLFAGIEGVFTDIELAGVDAGSAECEMMRVVDGLFYSFPVSFRVDVDGGWRLWQF